VTGYDWIFLSAPVIFYMVNIRVAYATKIYINLDIVWKKVAAFERKRH